MSNIIRIDLDFAVQEFEIAGKIYKLNYNDESFKVLQKQMKKFFEKIEELNKLKPEKMNAKQEKEYEEAYYSQIKALIDSCFGEGSYEDLFERTGKSSFVMLNIIEAIFKWINEKFVDIKNEKKSYYTKK